MKLSRLFGATGALLVAMSLSAAAADPVRIGMITTLSGALGYGGEDVRDGFLLAIDQEQGKLGGVPVAVSIEDDGQKPGNGRQIAEKFINQEKIKLFTGILFSNVLEATLPDILDSGSFFLSPNPGPSTFAGKGCNKNYFVVSWQNDSQLGAAGQNATNLGYKKMFLLAPNYQAGKDGITGFKRFYKGEIAGEIYTKLDQTDFAPEIAQIREAKPDAVFEFQPGGLGITFLKQYVQAGLRTTIPLVVAITAMDLRIRAAVGDAALGLKISTHWAEDFDNPANKQFVAAFRARYKRAPSFYAAQGYDTARLAGSALKAVNGDVAGHPDEFRNALRKADFASVRGKFSFAKNQHPIEDWYGADIVKGDDGGTVVKTRGKILEDYSDAYVGDCKM